MKPLGDGGRLAWRMIASIPIALLCFAVQTRHLDLTNFDSTEATPVPRPSEEVFDALPPVEENCLKSRNHSVPVHMSGNLSWPVINLGFPKIGSSTLQAFFGCGGYTTLHYRCGQTFSCASCTRRSIELGIPPLAKCGRADAYTQIDSGDDLPQLDHLEEINESYPNATFLLTFRDMEGWFRSLTNFNKMRSRMMRKNLTGLPAGKGRDVAEFSDWFCGHVRRVRDLVARNPQHALVEIDITDSGTGRRLEDVFGIDRRCWGHANENTRIHSHLDSNETNANETEEIDLSQYFNKWLIEGREGIGMKWVEPLRDWK